MRRIARKSINSFCGENDIRLNKIKKKGSKRKMYKIFSKIAKVIVKMKKKLTKKKRNLFDFVISYFSFFLFSLKHLQT